MKMGTGLRGYNRPAHGQYNGRRGRRYPSLGIDGERLRSDGMDFARPTPGQLRPVTA